MKFALSVAVLALSASQVMGYAATPIKGCTKTVVVQATDLGCESFAAANGVTFDDLLKWNTRLSKVCDNLDVGFPICVSVTQGAASTGVTVPGSTTAAGPAPTGSTAAPGPSGTAISTKITATTATSGPAGTATSAPAPKPTNSASGSKASVALAAAGVLLSVVYML